MTSDPPRDDELSSSPFLDGPLRLPLTRLCLRSGTVQLPFVASDRIPEGTWTLRDRASGDEVHLTSTPPRTLSGLREYFERHALDVNDSIVLSIEGIQATIDVEKRMRRPKRDVAPSTWHSVHEAARPRDEGERGRSHAASTEEVPKDEGVDAAADADVLLPSVVSTADGVAHGHDEQPEGALSPTTVRVVRLSQRTAADHLDEAAESAPGPAGHADDEPARDDAPATPSQEALPFDTPAIDDAPRAPTIRHRHRIPEPPTVDRDAAEDRAGLATDRDEQSGAPADAPARPSLWSRLWRRAPTPPVTRADARLADGDDGDRTFGGTIEVVAEESADDADDGTDDRAVALDEVPWGAAAAADLADDVADDVADDEVADVERGAVDAHADDWTDAWNVSRGVDDDPRVVFGTVAREGADADSIDASPLDDAQDDAHGDAVDEAPDGELHGDLDDEAEDGALDADRVPRVDANGAVDADEVDAAVEVHETDESEDEPSMRPAATARSPRADASTGRERRAVRREGDLRTRLVQFLSSPQMHVVAKADFVARRFGLDVTMAAALLEDIEEAPPPGMRLVRVRADAWRIERITT